MSEIIQSGETWINGNQTLQTAFDVVWVPAWSLYFSTNGTNNIRKSTDGKTWTTVSIGTCTIRTALYYSVEKGILVAMGLRNAGSSIDVMWTTDGVNWNKTTSVISFAGTSSSLYIQKITYSPSLGMFCAAFHHNGTRTLILSSTDGKSWIVALGPFDASLNDIKVTTIVWAGGTINKFVAFQGMTFDAILGNVDLGGYTSVDGSNWVRFLLANSIGPKTVNEIIWSETRNLLVVVTDSVGHENLSIFKSSDAATWVSINGPSYRNWKSVCYSPQRDIFLAVSSNGANSVIISRDNATNWSGRKSAWDSINLGTGKARVIYNPDRDEFIAVGSDTDGSSDSNTGTSFYPEVSESFFGEDGPIYLFEIEYFNIATQTSEVLYYATESYNHPTAPAGQYLGIVTAPPDFNRYLLSPGSTTGPNRADSGSIILANNNGALDGMRAFGLAGKKVTIRFGYKNLRYETFLVLCVATIEQSLPELIKSGDGQDKDIVTLKIRDRLVDLQKQLQTTLYLGTNISGDNGVEGGVELRDKPKPLGWGTRYNVSAVLINASLRLYQTDSLEGTAITFVYDNGEALTNAGFVFDIFGTIPTPGTWVYTFLSVGIVFRLGADPSGAVTFDCQTSGPGTTAAQIAYQIIKQRSELVDADINLSDIALLDTLNDSIVGIQVNDISTIQAPVDAILASIGASVGFDRLDILRMRRLNLPLASDAIVTLRDASGSTPMGIDDLPIEAIRFIATNDPDKGIPTYQITLNYKINYTVQSSGIAGNVTTNNQDRVDFLNKEYRSVSSSASWVLVPYPQAVFKTVNTLLTVDVDAKDECDRVLTVYAGRRDFAEIETPLTRKAISLIDIGDTMMVAIAGSRYGYLEGPGLPVILTGISYNTSTNRLILQVWGGIDRILDAISGTTTVDYGHATGSPVGWTTFGSVNSGSGKTRIIDLGHVV